MKQTFEEYLEEKFSDTREFCGRAITKDNCEDLFCAWLEDLDPQEFIDFGDEYSAKEYNRGVSDMHKEAKVSLDNVMGKKDWNEALEKLSIIKSDVEVREDKE